MMDNKKVGALWKRVSKSGKEYYAGYVNDTRVVAFINENKRTDKSPDVIFKVRKEKEGCDLNEKTN